MMNNNSGEEAELEVRPSGMLVQKSGDADLQLADATVNISVSNSSEQHDLHVPAHSTFGYVKKVLSQKTGLEPVVQKILFRGQEKEDTELLHTAGVKDNSKVMLIVDPTSKERQVEEQTNLSKGMAIALTSIEAIRAEVDRLCDRVAALEVAVNGGTKIRVEEFDMSAELLMRQLLKLDGIDADGEARVQRKAEVRRVQKFHELIDSLKARNANPFRDQSKEVSVSTEWESFDNGVGNLDPPPPSLSSTKVTSDWERFD